MSTEQTVITEAVVLAAGLGTRMRPLTLTRPKPLIEVNSKTLLDHAIDSLALAGVTDIVANVHYLPDQIIEHLAQRSHPQVGISVERDQLLDSGGGVKKAIEGFSSEQFLIVNADSFWKDGEDNNISKLAAAWDPGSMDMLLLVCRADQATGFDGAGDFFMDDTGRLTRRGEAKSAPYIYAGAIVAKRDLLLGEKDSVFSLNRLFDKAISAGRLFGCVLDGIWLHVGTPDAIMAAETAIVKFDRERAQQS